MKYGQLYSFGERKERPGMLQRWNYRLVLTGQWAISRWTTRWSRILSEKLQALEVWKMLAYFKTTSKIVGYKPGEGLSAWHILCNLSSKVWVEWAWVLSDVIQGCLGSPEKDQSMGYEMWKHHENLRTFFKKSIWKKYNF